MTVKMPAAKTLTMLLSAVAVAALTVAASQADAQTATKRKPKVERDVAYSSRGPNVSYQSGPHTRVYVTKRSWLDAGVEVLPGDRKFSDYAFPQGQSFATGNMNRPLDRQPLNPPSDFGYGDSYQARGFPLY